MSSRKPSRHVGWSVIEKRLKAATPCRDAIPGQPRTVIDVGADGSLSMCVFGPPAENESLPDFEHLECIRVGKGKTSFVRLSCSDHHMMREFYVLLMRTADRVQTDGVRVDIAISEATLRIKEMVAVANLLSIEAQLGLWGELHVLGAAARKFGWPAAIAAWAHSREANEEHDFALNAEDLEVKTTSREKRIHTIGGTQLEPKLGRRLLICSIQLTTAGSGPGESLTTKIEQTAKHVPGSVQRDFSRALSHAGWREDRASNYQMPRWVLRSAPLVVDRARLPRLSVTGPTPERVESFEFTLNLTGIEPQMEIAWL